MARRPRSYYLVAGIDLRRELERLRALPVFADGPLAAKAPELKVRRSSTHPVRLGFAVPSQWRLSVTAYPAARPPIPALRSCTWVSRSDSRSRCSTSA